VKRKKHHSQARVVFTSQSMFAALEHRSTRFRILLQFQKIKTKKQLTQWSIVANRGAVVLVLSIVVP